MLLTVTHRSSPIHTVTRRYASFNAMYRYVSYMAIIHRFCRYFKLLIHRYLACTKRYLSVIYFFISSKVEEALTNDVSTV